MDLLRQAKKLEARLTRVVDRATEKATRPGTLDPLEVLHAVVARIAAERQPVGRGRHVFPFNRIKVLVAAPSAEARARIAAVFESEPSLQDRIADQLRAARCEIAELSVKVVYLAAPQPEWIHPQWHLELSRGPGAGSDVAPAPASLPPTAPTPITLVVVKPPAAEHPADAGSHTSSEPLTFRVPRIELGRCAEVRDEHHRLIRTNHVALPDAAEHHTVSRRHAHIAFVADAAEYRVYDDGSVHGTSVLRHGRTIAVPSGTRGVRLLSDDEILLGESRIRVQF